MAVDVALCNRREQDNTVLIDDKSPHLPFDILHCICQHLEEDKRTLFRCALLSRDANHAATRLLYRIIIFEPPYWYGYRQRSLEETDIPVLFSATRSRNARYVRRLEVRGYLSLRSSTAENREILSRILDRAVKTFPNIRSVALLPSSYYSELFSGVLETLSQLTQLQELSVNRSSLNDAYLAYLRKIVGLKALTIRDPLSAFTKLLSEGWLGRMSGSLVELHLEGICCAIPSHVLYAELANLKRIRTLSIGYLGAQSESSLFSALASLPDLRFLSLQYDEEIPENCYRLSLISLTIRYFGPQSQSDSSGLCSWVQAIMSSCPLEELHLIDDNGEAINGDMGRDENFHRFVQYIVLHHASTLRVLRMPNIFFGADTLECLYAKCNSLEELTFATSRNALLSVYPSHPNMRSLCALSVSLRDVDGNGDLHLSLADAGVIMGRIPSLRSLIANNSEWKSSWVTSNDSHFLLRIAEPIGI